VGTNSDIDWRGRSDYLCASGGIAAVSSHAGFDLRNIQTFYETRKTTKNHRESICDDVDLQQGDAFGFNLF